MGGGGVRERFEGQRDPKGEDRERARGIAAPAAPDGAHLAAVFGAEGRGVETQQKTVDAHLRSPRGESAIAGHAHELG